MHKWGTVQPEHVEGIVQLHYPRQLVAFLQAWPYERMRRLIAASAGGALNDVSNREQVQKGTQGTANGYQSGLGGIGYRRHASIASIQARSEHP